MSPSSSAQKTIDFTKHTLIGLQVTGGLLFSVGTSNWWSCLIGTIVALQIGIFLHFDALIRQELDISERHLKEHFPEDVRDRLQEQQQQQQQQLQEEVDCDGLLDGDSSSLSTSASAPIFDLHPEATVLFADLKGFTQWSHNRNPDDVFQLLEALYAAIDELAIHYHVYKIETVGDCYLAVAGAPTADPDHALHMAQFAQAMLERSTQLLRGELPRSSSLALPDGTSQLQLRVGLHSGPVVLGVLRCAKQRLQIFGDTVNKASRMESTGQGGKIQISSATAHYLSLKHNKGHWLARRLGRVEAKGLGRVVTYWLDTTTKQKLTTTTTTKTKHHNRTRTTSTLEHLAVDASSDEFLENWLSYATSNSATTSGVSSSTKTGNSRHTTSHGALLPRGRLLRARSCFGPLPPSQRISSDRTQQQILQRQSSSTNNSSFSNKPTMTVQRQPLFLSSRSRSVGNCFVVGVPACPMQ